MPQNDSYTPHVVRPVELGITFLLPFAMQIVHCQCHAACCFPTQCQVCACVDTRPAVVPCLPPQSLRFTSNFIHKIAVRYSKHWQRLVRWIGFRISSGATFNGNGSSGEEALAAVRVPSDHINLSGLCQINQCHKSACVVCMKLSVSGQR